MYRPNDNDSDFLAHVGWQETSQDSEYLAYLFSDETINVLSKQITDALKGVDEKGRDIIIPNDKIANVLSSVYRFGTVTDIGSPFSKDIVPNNQERNDVRNIFNQTINIIVSTIRDEIEIIQNNKKLSVWDTVLGSFNNQGLRSHAPIKIRKRHPQMMAFNMNY